MTARKWAKKLSPAEWRNVRKRARAAAKPYATGEKVRRHESPRAIAQHGREPWPAKKAAEDAHKSVLRAAYVGERYPTVETEKHRRRKTETGKRHRTSTGGEWTLRKANVTRAKDGTFRKRKKR